MLQVWGAVGVGVGTGYWAWGAEKRRNGRVLELQVQVQLSEVALKDNERYLAWSGLDCCCLDDKVK